MIKLMYMFGGLNVIILLLIATIINLILFVKIFKIHEKNLMAHLIEIIIFLILLSSFGSLLQNLANVLPINIDIENFEVLISPAFQLVPVLLLYLMLLFTDVKRSNSGITILFGIPFIGIALVLTNCLHHLVFVNYSLDSSLVEFGIFYWVIATYELMCVLISYLLYITILIKEHNDFVKTCNSLFVYCILPISIFCLDIFFSLSFPRSLTILLLTPIAIILYKNIYKEKPINISSVDTADLVNKITDTYIVLDVNDRIIQTNNKFPKELKNIFNLVISEKIFASLENLSEKEYTDILDSIAKVKQTKKPVFEEILYKAEKNTLFFEYSIIPLLSEYRKRYIGCLITVTDVTKQKNELLTIANEQKTIINQQQLATIGELTSGFAHDINTPISSIKTALSMLKYNPNLKQTHHKTLENMEKSVAQIIDFSTNVRNQLRNVDSTVKTTFNIKTVVQNVVKLSSAEAEKRKCNIVFTDTADVYTYGNSANLSQTLSNLILNAIYAYKESGGKIVIKLKKDKKNAHIVIQDFACGLPSNIIPYVFKRILPSTSKNSTGLGLYISYSIIKTSFNGDITFTTKENEGTTFKITIPITKEEF